MKKILFIACALCICAQAFAQDAYGPYPNYKGLQESTALVTIPTTSDVWINNPFGGNPYHIKSKGGQEFQITYTAPVFADSYVYPVHPPERPFDPKIDSLILTEIFTLDLEPGLDPNLVPNQKGFYVPDPEIYPASSNGFFQGISGTIYQILLNTIQTEQLRTYLPGIDVNKIQVSPGTQVYVLQGTVPAWDFVEEEFEFSFDYGGYITQSDSDWKGPKNPLYPYQHKWQLNINKWADVNYISDVHIEQPWEIIPGYIEVVPPLNWHDDGIKVGRYGYESNPGSEIKVGGGSLGFQWRVNGKVPAVIPGHAYLTMSKFSVSKVMPTMVVDNPQPHCGDMGYLDSDLNKDCAVDFLDLAILANDWLKCTDPQGLNCMPKQIVGVGFGFNADDANSPAVVTYLPNPAATPWLDVNDIIVKYQGVTIYSGYQLMDVINARRDPNVGDPITMEVVKEATGISAYIIAPATSLIFVGGHSMTENKKCIERYRRGQKVCECVNYPEVKCSCGFVAISSPSPERYDRTIMLSSQCMDSAENECTGDTIYLR